VLYQLSYLPAQHDSKDTEKNRGCQRSDATNGHLSATARLVLDFGPWADLICGHGVVQFGQTPSLGDCEVLHVMNQIPTVRRTSLARLLRIILELQGGRAPSTRQLAEVCEVSRRTIFRDLATIEAAGIVVEYDPARLGYRLGSTKCVDAERLDDLEVIALFLQASRIDQLDDSGLAESSLSGALKLLHTLPDSERARLETVVAPPPLRAILSPASRQCRIIHADLIEGIRRGVIVELRFRKISDEVVAPTDFSPYGLYHDAGWTLLGVTPPDREVIRVEIRSIEAVALTDRPVVVPPRFRAEEWLRRDSGIAKIEVHLRIEMEGAPLIAESGWTIAKAISRHPDGQFVVEIGTDRLDSFIVWCIRHADRVEATHRESIRRKIRDAALRLVDRYATDEPRATA
jgi:predicted DNA-binding transcriptional regulator YafY